MSKRKKGINSLFKKSSGWGAGDYLTGAVFEREAFE